MNVIYVVFSVCIMMRGVAVLVYGKCECFVMQLLYACVLCASCGCSPCCVLNDLQFVNAGRRGDHMEETYPRAGLITALYGAMRVSFCLPHPVAVSDFYDL